MLLGVPDVVNDLRGSSAPTWLEARGSGGLPSALKVSFTLSRARWPTPCTGHHADANIKGRNDSAKV